MLILSDVFDIQKNEIKAKHKCNIIIDTKEYPNLLEEAKYFILPGILLFYFSEFEDYAQVVVNYNVNLMKSNNIEQDKLLTIISYEKDETVVTKDYYSDEIDMRLLINLLQGRIKYIKDPAILLNMLIHLLPQVDMVHFELIISNMFRTFDDKSKRCRLTGNYKNNIILGQTAQPFEDSWESAMLYRNINKAITKGLVYKQPSENNPIEKIANEQFGI